MKKILFLTLMVMLLLSLCLTVVSCTITPSASEVTLQSVSTSTKPLFEQTASVGMTALLAANDAGTTEETEEPSKTTTEEDAPEKEGLISDLESNITIIYKTQTTIYFTINLTNPKNYYILDFKLSTDNPDDKIQVKQGSHYSYINDPNTFIRWDEASDRIGNHQATFEIVLPSPEISPSVIKISEMYYSDRNDGTNKTAVNMNNKDVFTVYKVDKTFEFVDRRNSTTEF